MRLGLIVIVWPRKKSERSIIPVALKDISLEETLIDRFL